MSEEKKEAELKDEQLDAVTGGCEPKDSSDHSNLPRWKEAHPEQGYYISSGIVEGANILQGSGWKPQAYQPKEPQLSAPDLTLNHGPAPAMPNVLAPEPPVPKP